MTINLNCLMTLNLQMFAEGTGGDGGTGSEGSQAVSGELATSNKGVKSNPLADVKYGIQDDEVQTTDVPQTDNDANSEPAPVDRKAEFKKLIKGDYKDLYDAEVQDIVQRRLKGTKEQVAKLESLAPLLELIANKYGVNSDDAEALVKAVEDDDSYFEDEALEKGLTVEQLKHIRKIERENAEAKKFREEQEAREQGEKILQGWLKQAEETKQLYPGFDFDTEMENPEFRKLLQAKVPVKIAFQVLHQDEIIPAAMQYTAKTVEKKIADKIVANGARPVENGISSQSASLVKSDVSQLSKADRQEIIRRVQRGEKIRF